MAGSGTTGPSLPANVISANAWTGWRAQFSSRSAQIQAGDGTGCTGLYWPPSAAALRQADDELRTLVEADTETERAAQTTEPGDSIAESTAAKRRARKRHNIWQASPQPRLHASAQEDLPRGTFAKPFQPDEVAEMLLLAHAWDVKVVDVRDQCDYAEHLVLATASTPGQASAAASAVLYKLKQRCAMVAHGTVPGIEGVPGRDDWLLVDAGSVVVHVFTEDGRAEYDLDGMWSTGTNTRLFEGMQTQTLDTLRI